MEGILPSHSFGSQVWGAESTKQGSVYQTQVGVTTSKRQTSILQMFSLHSPDDSYDEAFLANYII